MALQQNKALSLRELLKPRPKLEHWAFPLLTRGGKLLFGGQSKTGKSWLAGSMAKSLLLGTPFWGNPALTTTKATGGVLLLDFELGEETAASRAARYFGGLTDAELDEVGDRFHYVDGSSRFKFDQVQNKEVLRRLVDTHGPNVVIMDPVGRFVEDENSNDNVKRFSDTLDAVRGEFLSSLGLSYVLPHHFKKPTRDFRGDEVDASSAYNFRGASSWFDVADAVVTVVRKDVAGDDHWQLKCSSKARHGKSLGEFTLDVRPDEEDPISWCGSFAATRALAAR